MALITMIIISTAIAIIINHIGYLHHTFTINYYYLHTFLED